MIYFSFMRIPLTTPLPTSICVVDLLFKIFRENELPCISHKHESNHPSGLSTCNEKCKNWRGLDRLFNKTRRRYLFANLWTWGVMSERSARRRREVLSQTRGWRVREAGANSWCRGPAEAPSGSAIDARAPRPPPHFETPARLTFPLFFPLLYLYVYFSCTSCDFASCFDSDPTLRLVRVMDYSLYVRVPSSLYPLSVMVAIVL